MSLQYNSEFIFIGKGDESFLENYSYELSEDSNGQGGKIFMALEILNNQAEAEDIGEAIFANFKQSFYANLQADPYERFENALKDVNKTINTLKEEKVSRFIGNLNIAIGAVAGEGLYVSAAGDAEVYLVRKRFVSIVSEGLAEESKKEVFVNIANGTLESGDSVLFSSSRLLRYITKVEMGKIFSDLRPNEIGRALVDLQDFIMTEILGRSAVIGLAASETEEELTEEDEEQDKLDAWVGGISARGGIFNKIASFAERIKFLRFLKFSKIKEKISSLIPGKIFQKPLQESKLPKIQLAKHLSKEKILATVVVLLLVLVAGIFWLQTRGNQQRLIAQQQTKLNHAKELISDASTTGQFDKTKASELLVNAEKTTLEVLNSRYLRSDAVKTLDDIQRYRDMLDDVKRIAEPTLLADFAVKRSNVQALGLISLKDRLFGFEYNALYEMVLDKLQDPLTISDLETVILGADYPDQNSLLFLTRTGKMIQYDGSKFANAVTKDGIWKKGVDMKTYNDRVYILDPERSQIWKYPRIRDGFDVGQQYSQDVDLKNAVSLAIDSSIYVLNSDGTITYLYQGQKHDYPLRKPPLNSLIAPTKIFTTPESNYLFILEPGKQRVVLFKKDLKNGGAQYQTQYVFAKIGELRDMVVSENRLYVMDDKRVYYINLSGL